MLKQLTKTIGTIVLFCSVSVQAAPATDSDWMHLRHALLQNAVADSQYELHRLDNAWLVKIYARDAFKSDRPELLLPSALVPIGKLSRKLADDPEIAVLILGMSAESGLSKQQHISHERARVLASIFRLSQFSPHRLQAFGIGASPNKDKDLAISLLVLPNKDLPAFAASFKKNPVFLAKE